MHKPLLLGLGTGGCGLFALARLLNRQPGVQVSHEEPPLLPWKHTAGGERLRERFARFRRVRPGPAVGDVASFYLPYVEEAVALEPAIRIVCLQRPREEVVANLGRWLDQSEPLPTNHWAQRPAPGWHHSPLRSRLYPKYDMPDRAEGIRRYWDEYTSTAEQLARRYPENFRVFDAREALDSEAGQRELLNFLGIPAERQVLAGGLDVPRVPERPLRPRAKPFSRNPPDPADPRRCVVLVPFTGSIVPACESALRELERRGYDVRRVGGYAAIDQGRNQMATDALLDGYEETMWIDADVEFHPDDVSRLRWHGQPIVCGIYPQKGRRALACHVLPGAAKMVFGRGGGLTEILYAGTGFLLVRREVYLAIQDRLDLPMCNERFGSPMLPFFHPMLHPCEEGHWYLAEDYAFCQRARQCGYQVYADTSIRLWHVGTYRYGWEDAGMDRERSASFTLNFPDRVEEEPRPIAIHVEPPAPPAGEGNGRPPAREPTSQDHPARG